jgi:hypothetical protein
MKIKLENGRSIIPKDHHTVKCEDHNFKTTWGALDPIQRLAVEEGLDVSGNKCILDSSK